MSSDLVADLSAELAAPRPVAAPAPAAAAARRATPALSVVLTPLQWARPTLRAAAAGRGLVLRVGPWQVEARL